MPRTWKRMWAGIAVVAALCAGTPVAAAEREFKVGILTPLDNTTWDEISRVWAKIEQLGFDSAWVNDHLLGPPPAASADDPQLEGWTTLAALAAVTPRIEVGTLVTGVTYRNPALLAKMATTVDQISGGRLALGMGSGWFEEEHVDYGFRFGTARERAEKLEEALQVISKLWSGEDEVSFDGKYYTLTDAPFAPSNVQKPRPPLIVGGQGKKWIVPLVGRWADGWNASDKVSPEGFRERVEIIQAECAKVGRDPCPTRFSKMLALIDLPRIPGTSAVVRFGARLVMGDGASSILTGTTDSMAEGIRDFLDAGATEVIIAILPPYDDDTMELLETLKNEVLPKVDEEN
ncbi:MAG: TIGR03560 family F420-dependent LLM class oxidoreductase [Candidatus Binatia bacterium]|nr:TIGR03560 family F420-dependent LLM class oxidoreductase [Candidatus Binatia bacterium]